MCSETLRFFLKIKKITCLGMNSTVISFQLQLCLILHVDNNTCSIAPPPTQSVRHFKGFVFRTTRGYVDCLFAISMAISKGFNSFFLCSSDPMMISLLHPTPSQNSSIRIFLEPVLLIRFPSFILSEKKKMTKFLWGFMIMSFHFGVTMPKS